MIALKDKYAAREAIQKQQAKTERLSKWLLPFSAVNALLAISNIFINSTVLLIVVWILIVVWVGAEIAYYVMLRKGVRLRKEYMEVLDREYSRYSSHL